MSMLKHSGSRAFGSRWLSASSLVCFALLSAVGCGDEEKGTDIEVPAPGDGGDGGSNNGGSNNHAGSNSPSDGGAPEGGANDGGMTGSPTAGTGGNSMGGVAGKSSGGNAGMSGSAGSNNGNAGTAGNAGSGGGGAGGMSGSAGMAGSAGHGGTAGSAGTAGTAGSAGTAGTAGNTSTCGDGDKEGTEECDDSGPSRLCSDDCRTVSTPACVECEQAGDCAFSSDNCLGPEATPFTTAQIGLCYDVLRCIQDANCLDGAGSIGKCYCGTLVGAACDAAPFDLTQPGAPNGPCAKAMQLGAPGVTSNAQMRAGVTTKSRPTGAAGQRLNCQKTDEACKSICGVQ